MHPLAVLVTDIHLSEKPPLARSAEPDWFRAQLRPVRQLKRLALKLDVPVVCGGDVFDHWRSSPELINWALKHLPEMWSIPGQHDLPLHSYADMDRSAYGVLVRAGKLHTLPPGEPVCLPNSRKGPGVVLWGFPWGFPVSPRPSYSGSARDVHLAVVHAYIWRKGASFPGAPEESRLANVREQLVGYSAAVFGDNHKPFLSEGPVTVFNHGGFQRRKSDEMDHTPALGVLMSDGSIELHPLDCTEDKWLDTTEVAVEVEDSLEMQQFLAELGKLGASSLDFREAVQQWCRKYDTTPGARRLLKQILP